MIEWWLALMFTVPVVMAAGALGWALGRSQEYERTVRARRELAEEERALQLSSDVEEIKRMLERKGAA